MTPCTTPRCSAPARWRVAGTDRTVCGDHIPDSTPVEPLPLPGILAAWCPPGWRRDSMTGTPVMPCVGKLLFPGGDVPLLADIMRQCGVIAPPDGLPPINRHALALAEYLLVGAAKRRHLGEYGLDQADEVAIASIVDDLCRLRGTVRIEKRGGEWVEVATPAESSVVAEG